MTKKDLLTPIGITFGFAMMIFAITSSGRAEDLPIFLDVAAIFIVLGGVFASLMISFKLEQMKLLGRVIKESFVKTEEKVPELIALFVRLSERARREGILALENELEEVEDPFIKKGIMLAVDGIEPEVITDILNAEITAMEERHYKGRVILEKAAEYSPAWGMIGTLIGLILMLNQLQDPSTLGPAMAVALITTLYGTVLANLVFAPMSKKLESKTEQEVFLKEIIVEGIIGVQSGQNPRILEEKLSAFVPAEEMQKYKEQKQQEGSTDAQGFMEDRVHEA